MAHERVIAIRARAWELLGPKVRHIRAFTDGDLDQIYGFDDIAQTVGYEFPEIKSAEQLYELLASDAPKPPSRDSLLKTARAIVDESKKPVRRRSELDFDFGYNAF